MPCYASANRRTRSIPQAGLALALLLVTPLGSACGSGQRLDPGDYSEEAEFAYRKAEQSMERGDYELGAELFQGVYQDFPYSQYATLAELRVADCWFSMRSYPRAVEAYRRFVQFHPTHEEVPWAEYRMALSYYEEMPGEWWMMPPAYERELSSAYSALDAFTWFVAEWPASEWAADAQTKLDEVIARLAGWELYVAEYYVERENPAGTARRCSFLLDRYPTAPQVPEALFLLARSLVELDQVEEAVQALHRLIDEHPDSDLAGRAEEYLERYGL